MNNSDAHRFSRQAIFRSLDYRNKINFHELMGQLWEQQKSFEGTKRSDGMVAVYTETGNGDHLKAL